MNELHSLLQRVAKPKKPYIMGSGKANKYRPTSLDGNRVLGSGAIVVKTVSIGGSKAPEDYDEKAIKGYVKSLEAYRKAKGDSNAV